MTLSPGHTNIISLKVKCLSICSVLPDTRSLTTYQVSPLEISLLAVPCTSAPLVVSERRAGLATVLGVEGDGAGPGGFSNTTGLAAGTPHTPVRYPAVLRLWKSVL